MGKSPNRGRSSGVTPEVMRVSMPPESFEGHQGAIAGPGQRTGAVYDPLQNGVDVEAPADAKAGLAQPGEAIPQRLIFSPQHGGFLERDARPAEYLRFCNIQIHGVDYTTQLPITSQKRHIFRVKSHTKYTPAFYIVLRQNNRKETHVLVEPTEEQPQGGPAPPPPPSIWGSV